MLEVSEHARIRSASLEDVPQFTAVHAASEGAWVDAVECAIWVNHHPGAKSIQLLDASQQMPDVAVGKLKGHGMPEQANLQQETVPGFSQPLFWCEDTRRRLRRWSRVRLSSGSLFS